MSKKLSSLLALFFILAGIAKVHAQNSALYALNTNTVQGITLNPAFFPDNVDAYFGIPVFSNLDLSLQTPFTLNSITKYIRVNSAGNSFRLKDFINQELGNRSGVVDLNFNSNLLAAGVRIGNKSMINLSFTLHSKSYVDSNFKSLLLLLNKGLSSELLENGKVTYTAPNFYSNTYTAVNLGYGYEFTPEFSVGLRVKYLSGTFYAQTKNADSNLLVVAPSQEKSHIRLNPYTLIYSQRSGSAFNYSGQGWGVDLGFRWKAYFDALPFPIEFSLSANDLYASITWSGKVNKLATEGGNFEFEGVSADYTKLKNNGKDLFKKVSDDFNKKIKFEETKVNNKTTTRIYPDIYLSANAIFNKRHQLGILYHWQVLPHGFKNRHTVGVAYRLNVFKERIALSAVPSVHFLGDEEFFSVASGLSIKVLRTQLYIGSEYLNYLFIPRTSRFFNLQAGFNIVSTIDHRKRETPTEFNWE